MPDSPLQSSRHQRHPTGQDEGRQMRPSHSLPAPPAYHHEMAQTPISSAPLGYGRLANQPFRRLLTPALRNPNVDPNPYHSRSQTSTVVGAASRTSREPLLRDRLKEVSDAAENPRRHNESDGDDGGGDVRIDENDGQNDRNASAWKDAIAARTAAIALDAQASAKKRTSTRDRTWRRLPLNTIPADWQVPDWSKNPLPNLEWETSYPGLLPSRLALLFLQYRSKEIKQMYGKYREGEKNGLFLSISDIDALTCEVMGVPEHQRGEIESRVRNNLNKKQRDARDLLLQGKETSSSGQQVLEAWRWAKRQSAKDVYLNKLIEGMPRVDLTPAEKTEIRGHIEMLGIEVL